MSSRRDASRAAIAAVARALGDERSRVVFVGGTVTALYPLAHGVDVRPTVDVDAVIDVVTTADYYAFVEGLRGRGFEVCTDEGAPLCRRVYGDVRVDIMATADTGIGPTNRWYMEAVAAAESYSVAPDLDVRAITPLYFVATKLDAFAGRGHGDYQASHDIEDVLCVLAGLDPLRSSSRPTRPPRVWRSGVSSQSWPGRTPSWTPCPVTSRGMLPGKVELASSWGGWVGFEGDAVAALVMAEPTRRAQI